MPAKKTVKRTPAKKTVRPKPPNAGKGRPKGSKNLATKTLKEAILKAYDKAGGVNYLVGVAKNDPKTFCSLLGRIIPHEVQADLNNTGEVTFNIIVKNPDGEN